MTQSSRLWDTCCVGQGAGHVSLGMCLPNHNAVNVHLHAGALGTEPSSCV